MSSLVGASALEQAVCAVCFGAASPLVGHPIDSVKTRMQADARYSGTSALATARAVVRAEGVRGLYRGLLPPLLGSMAFRSTQFGVFGAAMQALGGSELACAPVPLSGGLQLRVLLAATLATTARAAIEAPLEFIKVRRQMGARVLSADASAAPPSAAGAARELARLYSGGSFALTWLRLWFALTGFLCLVDHVDRHHPQLVALPVVGPFVKGSFCATLPWIVAWPAEVVKNLVQAGVMPPERRTLRSRLMFVVETRGGLAGLFRGIGPGLLRSVVANGAATLAFTTCRSCFRANPP